MTFSWDEVKAIYKKTNKPNDFLFNQWICRPPAAVLVYLLQHKRITPNQITFLSLFVALLSCATLVFFRGYAGGLAATGLLLCAFVLDCTDGQLARIRGTASPLGGWLDFLMDEIKAVGLTSAVGIRLGWSSMDNLDPSTAVWWCTLSLLGVFVVSSGISLTTFMRRAEYLNHAYPAMSEQVQAEQARDTVPRIPRLPFRPWLEKTIRGLEWIGRIVINYPSWIWLPAVLGHMEWFLIPYLVAHTLHLGRSGLVLLWRLGRSQKQRTTTA